MKCKNQIKYVSSVYCRLLENDPDLSYYEKLCIPFNCPKNKDDSDES